MSLPVLVANDANAAVLARYTFGGSEEGRASRPRRPRCRLRSAGERPGRYSATASPPGEIGHVTVGTDGGPVCVCGKVGCLEAWLSEPSLRRALAEPVPTATPSCRAQGSGWASHWPVVGALDLSEIVLSGPRTTRRRAGRGDRRDTACAHARRVPRRRAGTDDGRGTGHRPARRGRHGLSPDSSGSASPNPPDGSVRSSRPPTPREHQEKRKTP